MRAPLARKEARIDDVGTRISRMGVVIPRMRVRLPKMRASPPKMDVRTGQEAMGIRVIG
jgi:hypothetical protein